MKIYHYDNTGKLLGEGSAAPDPMRQGRWLIPAQATAIEPPAVADGNFARWNGAAWEEITPLPPPPAPSEPTPAELRRIAINHRLIAIDIASIRALRAKSAGKGKAADDTRLAALDAEADGLRAELAAL